MGAGTSVCDGGYVGGWVLFMGEVVGAVNPLCACGRGPVAVEIEGRVLVCQECADDQGLREHAVGDWR